MKRFGFVDKVLSYLKEAGIETQLFENVEPDPSVETVMAGAKVMSEFGPDWIIAMGGGSPIDAAKAMWAFYEYPDTTFEQLITPFSFPTLRTKAKFLAIPSTSGTATEVTAFSVITDYSTGVKYPLADFNITPDIAVVDPSLAEDNASKINCTYWYGRINSCNRSLCIHITYSVYRSTCNQKPFKWYLITYQIPILEIRTQESKCIMHSV